MSFKKQNSRSAFTLFELIIVIGVIAILSGIAMKILPSFQPAKQIVLEKNAKTLNKAVNFYLGNGGNLNGITNPEDVLKKLKSKINSDKKDHFVGITGSFIKGNLEFQMQSVKQAHSNDMRILWNSNEMKFFTSKNEDFSNIPGIIKFEINEDINPQFEIEEDRGYVDAQGNTKEIKAIEYAAENKWVWKYEEQNTTTNNPNDKIQINTNQNPEGEIEYPNDSGFLIVLDPPEILEPSGIKDFKFYLDKTIEIANPNPSSIPSKIKFNFTWRHPENANGWHDYQNGGIDLSYQPAWSILYVKAYVESLDPTKYKNSPITEEKYYHKPINLGDPDIEGPPFIDGNKPDDPVNIKIIPKAEDNDTHPGKIYYRIYDNPNSTLPDWINTGLVDESTPSNPGLLIPQLFDSTNSDFDKPIVVEAKITTTGDGFNSSKVAKQIFDYKLINPEIVPEKVKLSGTSDSTNVTINNPNDPNTTDLFFKIISADLDCSFCNIELKYTFPFTINYDHFGYADEINIEACVRPKPGVPLEEHYIESCAEEKKITIEHKGNKICTDVLPANTSLKIYLTRYAGFYQRVRIYRSIGSGAETVIFDRVLNIDANLNFCKFPNCPPEYSLNKGPHNTTSKYCFETFFDYNDGKGWQSGHGSKIYRNTSYTFIGGFEDKHDSTYDDVYLEVNFSKKKKSGN